MITIITLFSVLIYCIIARLYYRISIESILRKDGYTIFDERCSAMLKALAWPIMLVIVAVNYTGDAVYNKLQQVFSKVESTHEN